MFNIKKILFFCLPLFELINSEKTIREGIQKIIDDEELPLTSDEIKKVEIEEIQKYYDDTFLTKKTLEDKAKLGIIGVTITIGLVYSITSNYEKLSTITLILSVIALLYSLLAGYLALSILSDKNQVYKLSIKDLLLSKRVKKDALLINFTLNIKQNIIRQNYVYSSYRHLVYALIIMIMAFLINPVFYIKQKIEKPITQYQMMMNNDIKKTLELLNAKIILNTKTLKLLSKSIYHNKDELENQIKTKTKDCNSSKRSLLNNQKKDNSFFYYIKKIINLII